MVAPNAEAHMRRALELAERGWGRVSPNPLVGAVVVRDAVVVGEGWHEGPGTAHAEVMALRTAGDLANGATIVCTLEPCNRFGRTPPCTRALVDAGVARVVVGATDPDLGSDAPGVAELRAAGIDVETGVLEREARELNVAFERHVVTGRPFVVLKMASSLDGKTAAADGSSRWITGVGARDDVHRLRAWADAILVGAGTAIADDPHLTVRGPWAETARQPLRVVVDSSGRVSAELRLFDGAAATMVATTDRTPEARMREWSAAGADLVVLDRDAAGAVSLPALVGELGKRDVQGLLVEGGATLAWSALRDDVVDRIVLYLAPLLVGGAGAPPVLGGDGFAPISAAMRLGQLDVTRIDDDLKVVADVHRHR
jgi:diaminohydroxyphosphoribosylaminopyrimidine deaminase/5-amino-6-(5-phosphoribosylamino)uracil reductase